MHISLLCVQLMQAEQILIKKKNQKFREPSPFVMEKKIKCGFKYFTEVAWI